MTEQSESQKVRDRALEVAGLTRAYGEFHALKNISWSVDEGTWWGLLVRTAVENPPCCICFPV